MYVNARVREKRPRSRSTLDISLECARVEFLNYTASSVKREALSSSSVWNSCSLLPHLKSSSSQTAQSERYNNEPHGGMCITSTGKNATCLCITHTFLITLKNAVKFLEHKKVILLTRPSLDQTSLFLVSRKLRLKSVVSMLNIFN